MHSAFPEELISTRIPVGLQPPPMGPGSPAYAQNYYPSSSGVDPAMYGNVRQPSSSRYYQQQSQGGMPPFQGQSYPIAASIHVVPHPVSSSSSSSSMIRSNSDISVPQIQHSWPIIIRIGGEDEEESGTVEGEDLSPPLPHTHEDTAA